MAEKYKLIIVDDHELFRDGLKFVLSQSEVVEVVGEAVNGADFLEMLDKTSPEIVLMDIAMPVMDGIEATRLALKKKPSLKIIALSMFGDQDYYFRMIHAGVRGFVLKKSGKKELETAIRDIIDGDNYFSSELLRNIIINFSDSKLAKEEEQQSNKLSKRELEILGLICKGWSNTEIADFLNISPKTVEGHRNNLLSKTNSKNSINLVMYAIKNKLVEVH